MFHVLLTKLSASQPFEREVNHQHDSFHKYFFFMMVSAIAKILHEGRRRDFSHITDLRHGFIKSGERFWTKH